MAHGPWGRRLPVGSPREPRLAKPSFPGSCLAPLPSCLLCDPFPLTMESGLGPKPTVPQGGFSSSCLGELLKGSL